VHRQAAGTRPTLDVLCVPTCYTYLPPAPPYLQVHHWTNVVCGIAGAAPEHTLDAHSYLRQLVPAAPQPMSSLVESGGNSHAAHTSSNHATGQQQQQGGAGSAASPAEGGTGEGGRRMRQRRLHSGDWEQMQPWP
jgi:hypothetical protein